MDILIILGILAVAAAMGSIAARGIDPRRWPRPAIISVIAGVYGHLAENPWALGVAIAATVLGIIAPAAVTAQARRRAARGDFAGAARLARLLSRFQPTWRGWADVWSAADAWARGDAEPARAVEAELASTDTLGARIRREALMGLTRNWESARHATSIDLQSRALCELGEVEAGIDTAARAWAPRMRWSRIRRARGTTLAPLAFAGRVEATERLTRAIRLPAIPRAIWRATALAAAGRRDEGARVLDGLREMPCPAPLRAAIHSRSTHLPHPPVISPAATAVLDDLCAEVDAGDLLRMRRLRTSPVTIGVLALMAVGFVLQMITTTGPEAQVAFDLGALYAEGRLPDDPWRLLAYGFLHSGVAHLSANALAILVLGPMLHHTLGGWRALIVFMGGVLIGGVGISMFGAEGITVGASAGAMALLGAILVMTRLHRGLRATRTGRAAFRLGLMLVLFQTGLDAITPMISSAGHLSGGLAGIVLGALLTPRR